MKKHLAEFARADGFEVSAPAIIAKRYVCTANWFPGGIQESKQRAAFASVEGSVDASAIALSHHGIHPADLTPTFRRRRSGSLFLGFFLF